MMRRIYAPAREGDEAGGSVIVFVMALPIILLFLCALVDLGRVVFIQMAIDDAAQAACRLACEGVSAGDSVPSVQAAAERAVSAALQTDPAAISTQVQANVGAVERVEYSRRRYSVQDRRFVEAASGVESRKVEVAVTARITSLTPIGHACARATGVDDGRFCVEAQAAGVAWIAQKG